MEKMDGISKRYGKSMSDIFAIKKSFFEDNEKLLQHENFILNGYSKQPRRLSCKLCDKALPPPHEDNFYFTNRGTRYYLCEICGHLNGEFDDQETYSNALYSSGEYGKEYMEVQEEKFVCRVDTIYSPKVRFLKDSLTTLNYNATSLRYLDVGAGSGFMIAALDRAGLNAKGIEINPLQAAYANERLGRCCVDALSIPAIIQTIKRTDCDVLSFVNVFEHVTNLREMLEAIKSNTNIKFIFFCVPLLSLTCAFEIIFPEVWARHIGGGGSHTHLFSERSLAWIYKNYEFTPLSEWHFGTDIMDLYRSISVMLEKKEASAEFIKLISDFFQENTDAMQQLLDKSGLASDIHVLAQVH